jgi:hypothetical protein
MSQVTTIIVTIARAGQVATAVINRGGVGDALKADPLSQFADTSSAQLAGVMNDETGTGLLVFGTSPTLLTPALGTPTALVGTNITGTGANFTAGNVTTNANLTGHITSSGNAAILGSFTVAQLSTALSDATLSGNNTGDVVLTLENVIQRNTANKTIDATANIWKGNTDAGAFAYTLPPGIANTAYKIVNTGTSGNILTVTPDGSEELLGVNSSWNLSDGESLEISYEATDGWY